MAITAISDAELFALIEAEYERDRGQHVTVSGVVYRRITDNDTVSYVIIQNELDKTTFGKPARKWRGFYPPDTEYGS